MQLTRLSAAGLCLCKLRLSVYNLHRISKIYDLKVYLRKENLRDNLQFRLKYLLIITY